MLPLVKTKKFKLERYRGVIPERLYRQIKDLTKYLKGLKVAIINATPQGGGVAEILQSLVPLMKGLGIKAEWYVIPSGKKFQGLLTKEIHNALQGKNYSLQPRTKKLYLQDSQKLSKLFLDMKSDIWVLHDPQPAGAISYLPNLHPSISHIHIDTSHPNEKAWKFLRPFLLQYDRIIFSQKEFVHKDLPRKKIRVFPPAIEPFTEKNKSLKLAVAKKIIRKFGIDPEKPLISQVSRFDPWKDPLGVVKAFQLAKREIPNLQLAYLGLFLALDDPDALKIFKEVEKKVKGKKDIFLFAYPKILGNISVGTFVNAFQTASSVILQKSIREGFGLSVTEAMWKGKVVIGGNVGGIKIQIQNGKNGFLISSPSEAARRIVQLFKNPRLVQKLGKKAKETVKEKFLMPRLLRDYLKIFRELV